MLTRCKLLGALLIPFTGMLLCMLGAASAAPAVRPPVHPPASAGQPGAAVATAAIVQRTLPNGLKVLVWPRHTAPVVTTMMWYHVGSRDEVPGETGLAHFLEHLLFKGTHRLAKGEIDRLTYQNGGSNNAVTFNDYTAFEFNFPRRNWKVALRIEADRMRNCVFDRKEFEAERQVVMEERRGGQDDPEQAFGEQLSTLLFQVHPYRNPVIGWMGDIRRVPRDTVYAFYQRFYVPGNATLVITGDVDPAEALASAAQAFQAVPKLPVPQHQVITEPAQVAERRMRVTLPTQVARVALEFSGPPRRSPDVYALEILQDVLTEGRTSRLYRRLVDGDQTVADLDGTLGAFRDAGELTFNANLKSGIAPEVVESAVWQEFERLKREPITPGELDRAKNQFYSEWVNGLQTANQLASVLGESDAVSGIGYLQTLVARIQAVTLADVQRAAETYLRREHAVIGYLDPSGEPRGKGRESAPGDESGTRIRGAYPAARSRAARVRPAPVRQRPAARAQSVGFAPLEPVERRLPNGLHLILLENHDLPTVTLTARIDAGSFQDTDQTAGLANMTARMLDEGTRNRDHQAISAALEQVGASFAVSTGGETTVATLDSLSPRTEDLLPLFAELLRAPQFPEDRLEAERERLLVELRESADDAGYVAREAFDALVYGAHPAHRPVAGTAATVRRLTRNDLAEFHQRYYRPENTTIVAVGDFRAPALLAHLTEVFGDWPALGPRSIPRFPDPVRQAGIVARHIPMNKTQAQVILGHLGVRRRSPDFVPLRVMDTILGEGVSGGFTARIPYQLRDVQGLAYTVSSSITGSAGREPGVFIAALGTDPAKAQTAVAALLKEIRRIRSAGVTEQELAEAERYLADSYVFDFQTHGQLARYLQAADYYELGYNYRQRFPALVRRVTRADVLRTARQYLDPEHYLLVVVGPEPKSGARNGRSGK